MTEITVLTLFPQLFESILSTSILKRAATKKLVKYNLVDLRQFGEGKHQIVDGRPFGGGAGMIFRADILAAAWKNIKKKSTTPIYTILMSASGVPFNQTKAKSLSKIAHLVIICGHYEGVDQRFVDKYVDEEISIGDYVLTGGELPALLVIDSVVRLIPQVLKKKEATEQESFSKNSLEHPQYTRPEIFEGIAVPKILLSGHHQKIADWQIKQSLSRTKEIRPDLLKKKL